MDLFSNEAVEISTLPRAEEIILQPIEPSYWKVLHWGWMITWGIILLSAATIFILIFPNDFLLLIVMAGPLLLLAGLTYWLLRKSVTRKAYALRDKDIIYQSGWLVQRISVCPFNRIQHCSINSGPFERKLGLASLSVHTAGSEGADMKIPGLKEETALALRDFIMQKSNPVYEQSGI
ncbi:MAG: PH domain-containing protein [Ferruginibacter sp.]|nr:PH domain-containing protein [Chitinophagaceae bacterium]